MPNNFPKIPSIQNEGPRRISTECESPHSNSHFGWIREKKCFGSRLLHSNRLHLKVELSQLYDDHTIANFSTVIGFKWLYLQEWCVKYGNRIEIASGVCLWESDPEILNYWYHCQLVYFWSVKIVMASKHMWNMKLVVSLITDELESNSHLRHNRKRHANSDITIH